MSAGYETLTVSPQFRGKLLQLDRLEVRAPDGSIVLREMVSMPGSVAALPLDGTTVILIRQMRLAVGRRVLEIPAGVLDVAGESPEDAAARECEEEVGRRPGRMTLLAGFYNSPGYSDEYTHLYLAEDLQDVPARPESAEERDAEIVSMTLAEAVAMVGSGDIVDGKTVLALALADARLRRG